MIALHPFLSTKLGYRLDDQPPRLDPHIAVGPVALKSLRKLIDHRPVADVLPVVTVEVVQHFFSVKTHL